MLNSDLAVTHSPSENRNVTYTVENPNGGFGNQLHRHVRSTNTSPPTTWDFAYIVAPVGTVVDLDFYLAGKNFSKELIGGSFTVVPEPESIGLLATGLLLVAQPIWRRRRQLAQADGR